MSAIEFTVPIRTNTQPTTRDWRVRYGISKRQKEAVWKAIDTQIHWKNQRDMSLWQEWSISLTRISPGSVPADQQNLDLALKHVVDAVAEWLGVDDSASIFHLEEPRQERGPWGVRVRIERVDQ